MENCDPNYNINLKEYNQYHTDSESEKGGTLIYISKDHNAKHRKDLESIIYKSKELESTFIEIVKPNKKNVIIGCIYRHPNMDLSEFKNHHILPMLAKLEKENKTIYLLGDYNIDLMKLEEDSESATFFDNLTSNRFVPHIILPTRITTTSKTLIDNIFSNNPNFELGISGNLTISLSDHLAQFLLIPDLSPKQKKKRFFYKRDTKNFDRVNFLLDLLDIEWSQILNVQNNDVIASFIAFEKKMNELLDLYLPLKKMTKRELEQQQKPWITTGILNSMKRRDRLLKKFTKAKHELIKIQYHKEYKKLRNQIVALCRINKKTIIKTSLWKMLIT